MGRRAVGVTGRLWRKVTDDERQAFAEMRRLKPDARIILMSGFTEQEAISQFTGKGLADFLQKPFEPDSLARVLQRSLEAS